MDGAGLGCTIERLPGPYGDPGAARDLPVEGRRPQRTRLQDLPVAPTLAASDLTMCVARHNGAVVHCWGRNASGQASGGDPMSKVPVRVAGLPKNDPVVQLAVASTAICGLLGSGHIVCWGGNQFGELGNHSRQNSMRPVYVQGITRAARLVAGRQSFCAISRDGRVFCWGSPEPFDRLGGRGSSPRPWLFGAPNEITELGQSVRELVLGADEGGCIIRGRGEAACWGVHTTFEGRPLDARLAPVPTNKPVERIFLGPGANPELCVILADERLWCTGGPSDYNYRFGRLLPFEIVTRPLQIPATGPVATLAVGYSGHQCALRTDGEVLCWGNCKWGACVRPRDYVFPEPVLEGYFQPPTKAFVRECERYCFGDWRGKPDAGNICFLFCRFGLKHLSLLDKSKKRGDVVSPCPVPDARGPFSHLATMQATVCAVDAEGQVVCWGSAPSSNVTGKGPWRLRLD